MQNIENDDARRADAGGTPVAELDLGAAAAPISTARVIIRRFTDADLADFLAYQGHPLVREHQPGDAMNRDEAERFLAVQARQRIHERDAWHGRAVERIADRRVIGDVGIWLSSEQPGTVVGDLGFQLDPRYHGLGYAREAVEAFLPAVVRTFRLDRVTASCDEANRPSWALLERLGMHLLRRSDGQRQYGVTGEELVDRSQRAANDRVK